MKLVQVLRLVFLVGLVAGMQSAFAESTPGDLDRLIDALPVIDEIDTAMVPPIHEFPDEASRVETRLNRPTRVLQVADSPKVMAWVIGVGKDLRPGAAYVLEIDYPDDVARSMFVANRGADLVRGFATGAAVGDARQQYTQPSFESLNYPQTGRWQKHRTVFVLNDRFQGLYAQRDAKKGGRPFGPADGFHVIIFQTKHLNDPRSEGAAVGHLRLRSVPDLAALYPRFELPPPELPRRRIFFREEMADEGVNARDTADRGVVDPLQWLVSKAKLSRLLAINTFAKDLMEFGFNQGWDSGDLKWINNAQPPLTDLWDRTIPKLAAEGMDLMPYYEYKGAIGLEEAKPASLGWQRQAEKLYHNLPNPRYTDIWWTEAHNADLTDPETLVDARRVLDRTILAHKGKAKFAGAWFRVRDNHLPMSFADATLARFRAAFSTDAAIRETSRAALIASYEGDHTLYNRYVNWWLSQRAAFFEALREHLARGLDDDSVQILFTPWIAEPIPMLRDPASGTNGHPIQVVTDDPAWWNAFAAKQSDADWWRWALVPTPFDKVVKDDAYRFSLDFREPITALPARNERYHSAPNADPETYHDRSQVMLTYPYGRLFTVARPELLDRYRTQSGLTVVHHYPLNEDDHDRTKGASQLPFDGQVGYASVDVERAGPHVCLLEARALATGDPRNIGSLYASGYSTGFPGPIQRFNAAFVSVPALPSTIVVNATIDPEIVVREVLTPKNGTYYYAINTSMQSKQGVAIQLPAKGSLRDLLASQDLKRPLTNLKFESGEVPSYRVDGR